MCPLCKSTRYATIYVHDPRSYASIYIHGNGGMKLCACVDCGTVYLPDFIREVISNQIKETEK